jgi:diguanylate cyclase (GGDEF)-like protein
MEATDLLRRLERNLTEVAAFYEIGKALTSTLELGRVLELIMVKVGDLLAPSNWSLLLLDEKSSELIFELVDGPDSGGLQGQRLGAGEGLAGQVAQSGQPLLVTDVREDPRFSPRFDRAGQFETRSVLAVPLHARDRTLGVIELVNGAGGHVFTPDDRRTLSALADYAAIAIDNARNFARVQEITIIDEHTGLFNSRHLRATLATEVRRSERFHRPVSLVFLDLDHFKDVNDLHGHLVGSALLRHVGQKLKGMLRGVDIPTRYGGDEFAVVLPETDAQAALRAARRWHQELRQTRFDVRPDLQLTVTASFGVACFPDHASNEESLIGVADAAMYAVKNASRDGVLLAGSPPHRPIG